MTEREKLIIISDLAGVARDYVSRAIVGVIETDETLRIADSLLTASLYVRAYNNEEDKKTKQ